MPEYSFEDVKTGELVDLYMPADECVEIGKVVRRGGRRLRRLASSGAGMVEPDWAHTCFSMSDDDAKRYAPRVDARGFGQFENRREIVEAQAKMKADGKTQFYQFGLWGRSRKRSS